MAGAETLLLGFRQDFDDIAFEFGIAEIAKLDRHQVAVEPQHRGYAHGEMNVGTSLRQAQFQKCIDACHGRNYSLASSRSSAVRRYSMLG